MDSSWHWLYHLETLVLVGKDRFKNIANVLYSLYVTICDNYPNVNTTVIVVALCDLGFGLAHRKTFANIYSY